MRLYVKHSKKASQRVNTTLVVPWYNKYFQVAVMLSSKYGVRNVQRFFSIQDVRVTVDLLVLVCCMTLYSDCYYKAS